MKTYLSLIPVLLLVQHVGPERNAQSQKPVEPVLAFPDPELDDTAAYQGYQTRFYRDSRNNTVQIYLQPQTSRAVLVWADAANESVGFNARDSQGRPTRLFWGATAAEVADSDSTRSIEFRLTTPLSARPAGLVRAGLDAGGAGLRLRQGLREAVRQVPTGWRRSLCWWPTWPGSRRTSSGATSSCSTPRASSSSGAGSCRPSS